MKQSFIQCEQNNVNILENLIPLLHSFKNSSIEQTYIEPFLGSGIVFLNIEKYNNFILNDINLDIFLLFNSLKNNSELFTKDLKKLLKNNSMDKKYIYEIIKRYYKTSNYDERCKLFILLNSFGMNYLQLEQESNILENMLALTINENHYYSIKKVNYFIKKIEKNSVALFNYSFERIFENLEYGDIVYCDPPNINKGFSIEKHKVLNQLAFSACLKGIKVVISNEYNEMNKELYKDCSEYYIKRIRNFNNTTEEMIAIYA